MRFSLIATVFATGVLLHSPTFASGTPNPNTSNSDTPSDITQAVNQCRQIVSVFERLECYDNIKTGENSTALSSLEQPKGVAWNRAQQQEKARQEQDLQFLVTETETPNPTVILTTPALGSSPPRPILMFSCVDNITRLQVALPKSLGKLANIGVTLSTEQTEFPSQWFVREDGFLLEASRGLDGIKEIQRLFNANRLKIQFENKSQPDLVFNIEQLEDKIKPLKIACHW